MLPTSVRPSAYHMACGYLWRIGTPDCGATMWRQHGTYFVVPRVPGGFQKSVATHKYGDAVKFCRWLRRAK
jgi:hypothetical protein